MEEQRYLDLLDHALYVATRGELPPKELYPPPSQKELYQVILKLNEDALAWKRRSLRWKAWAEVLVMKTGRVPKVARWHTERVREARKKLKAYLRKQEQELRRGR